MVNNSSRGTTFFELTIYREIEIPPVAFRDWKFSSTKFWKTLPTDVHNAGMFVSLLRHSKNTFHFDIFVSHNHVLTIEMANSLTSLENELAIMKNNTVLYLMYI
jgi:hypothetical protein